MELASHIYLHVTIIIAFIGPFGFLCHYPRPYPSTPEVIKNSNCFGFSSLLFFYVSVGVLYSSRFTTVELTRVQLSSEMAYSVHASLYIQSASLDSQGTIFSYPVCWDC